MGYDLKLRVWRGNDTDGELRDYTVEVSEGEVVLDALHRVQATQSGDLAIRWNCKAGKCGSCSAEINGRPRLLCMTRLSDFEESETITVTPMRTFPVIRDLVTDVSFNYQKARELPAYAELGPARRRRQAADDAGRRRARPGVPQVHRVLPVPERLPRRPRPRGQQAGTSPARGSSSATPSSTCTRSTPTTGAQLAQEAAGIGMCNITKCCTEVCPEGIKITDNAIIPMKERVVDRKYDPLVWLGNKIGVRNKDNDGRTEV